MSTIKFGAQTIVSNEDGNEDETKKFYPTEDRIMER